VVTTFSRADVLSWSTSNRRLGGAVTSTLSGRRRILSPTAFIVGTRCSSTNEQLASAFEASGVRPLVVSPERAAAQARPGDLVIGRLDVRPTLDGVQPGLGYLLQIAERGIRIVNGADVLVATHDKLTTARLLEAASIAQPRWAHVTDEATSPGFEAPYVVKPRFGSWGRDVFRCETPMELRACLRRLRGRPWFGRHGAFVQELIPPQGFDLRLIVSAGVVVGAVERVAAPGEWRTNISLGGSRRPASPSLEACVLATRAAASVGGELVGVDLLPDERGWRVIEINGAVDFTDEYALDGGDVFARAVGPFVPTCIDDAVVRVDTAPEALPEAVSV
jgi:ribosomal protein S6--L-glutamate ligase